MAVYLLNGTELKSEERTVMIGLLSWLKGKQTKITPINSCLASFLLEYSESTVIQIIIIIYIHFSFRSIYGAGSCAEWAAEGRRLVPLMPRLVPQTVFSASATAAANSAAAANAKIPVSSGIGI